MKKFIAVGFYLLAMVFNLGAESYQDRVNTLVTQWKADGLDIKTGVDSQGVQNLAVLASNGYYPVTLRAKAGIKNTLRVYTNKSYDCSRAFNLPDLGIRLILPPKGVREIAIPAQPRGTKLYGVCSMGMYTFTIDFE